MLCFIQKDRESIDNAYKDILSNIKQSFTDMGIIKPLECYRLLHKLLVEGVFSVAGNVSFDTSFNYLALSNLEYLGVQVMYGVCCCRHVSSFINDVLNEFKFDASLLYVNVDDSSSWRISEAIDANHVVVLLKDLGSEYILDPFNSRVLKKEGNQDLTPLYFDSDDLSLFTKMEMIQGRVERIGKTLRKYYTLRDLGVQFIYDYDL